VDTNYPLAVPCCSDYAGGLCAVSYVV